MWVQFLEIFSQMWLIYEPCDLAELFSMCQFCFNLQLMCKLKETEQNLNEKIQIAFKTFIPMQKIPEGRPVRPQSLYRKSKLIQMMWPRHWSDLTAHILHYSPPGSLPRAHCAALGQRHCLSVSRYHIDSCFDSKQGGTQRTAAAYKDTFSRSEE